MIFGRFVRLFKRYSWIFLLVTMSTYVVLQVFNSLDVVNASSSRTGLIIRSQGYIDLQKKDFTVTDVSSTETLSSSKDGKQQISNKIVDIDKEREILNQIIKSRTKYFRLDVRHKEALLYGHYRNYTGFMTIGVPTVQRDGVNYLDDTLDSIIANTSPREQREIVVVVFFGDRNHSLVLDRAKKVYNKFKTFVDSGLIQLVHPQHELYPDFSKIKQNSFNDTRERISWRSKQNIDYAYLFLYSQNFSKYYLQLEDDVSSAKNFVSEIKRFTYSKNAHQYWFCLQFSNLGFIGKLFRSSDLQKIADFLLMFYAEQPGDLLLNYLKRIMTQFKDIVKKPALFQHRGVISSLSGKRQFNVERSFRDGPLPIRKKFYVKNPSAEIETTLEVYEDNHPEYAYDLSDRYFWAVAPSAGAYYRIVFHQPQNIYRIFVDTGHKRKPKDIIRDGVLKVSTKDEAEKKPCTDLKVIAQLRNGDIDTETLNITQRYIDKVDCVSIEVVSTQKDWVIIREVAIFVNKGI